MENIDSTYWALLLSLTGSGGAPAPTTQNFTYAQMAGGIYGPTDVVTDVTKRNMTTNGAGWAGFITGTDATIVCHRSAGDQTNQIVVSVDGGAFTAPAYSGAGGIFPILAGATQGVHSVVVRPGAAYANQVYIPTSGNVIAVTGVNPTVEVLSGSRVQPLDGNPLTRSNAYPAAAIGGNFVPSVGPANQSVNQTSSAGSSVPQVRFRTAATSLHVVTSSRFVFLMLDGGTSYTMYDTVAAAAVGTRLCKITGLSGSATTYHCWPSWEQSAGGGYGTFSISSDAVLTDCGTKRNIDPFGDSLIEGAGTTTTGDGFSGAVDILAVGAALGLTATTYGISGNTTNQLAQRFGYDVTGTTRTGTGFLANVPSGAGDVAVLATGRNDVTTGQNNAMTAQQITDYTNCVNALVLKYGKVICRGVLPTTGQNWSNYNASIQSIVTGLANSNVTYVNTNAWVFTYAPSDTTHADRPGYVPAISTYEIAAFPALI